MAGPTLQQLRETFSSKEKTKVTRRDVPAVYTTNIKIYEIDIVHQTSRAGKTFPMLVINYKNLNKNEAGTYKVPVTNTVAQYLVNDVGIQPKYSYEVTMKKNDAGYWYWETLEEL